MPKGQPSPTHPNFSPDSIRAAIRGRAAVPAQMLENALMTIHKNMSAKEVKFFSHQGMVVEQREVEALAIQNRAAELVFQMSELLAKQETKNRPIKTTLTVDPKTGVMTLVIGDDSDDEVPETVEVIETTARPVYQQSALAEPAVEEEITDEELELTYIKVPRGELPPEVREALFGKAKPLEPTVGT